MAKITPIKDNVDLIELEGRSIHLVGTAHVSQASVELAEEIIREVKPETVAVELCESRYKSLQDPNRWKNMDIVSVIKEGKAYVLMAQLMLSGFQKKLGNQLDIKPGAEMIQALAVAKDIDSEIVLADRDIRTTLKRTWSSLGFWSMLKLIFAMFAGLFTGEKIDEAEIERLKNSDALEELMREFSEALPEVRTALIDERDQYLAAQLRNAPGKSIVAIVGAGHIPGIKEWIDKEIDLPALETIPASKKFSKIIAWAIPLVVLGIIGYGFYSAGVGKGVEMFETWFWINACMGGLGALLAFAHPLTILAAFVASPFTSLNPLIAAGWVAGLVEAMIKKPRVSDLETIADDVSTLKGLWNNRLSKILLVIALTNLFGTIGTFIGIERITALLQ
ncbi:TraB/GumN family protein [Oligoflexia bacterium]|nr:TraB/GumN family protein [Oligoflexia bacterium]